MSADVEKDAPCCAHPKCPGGLLCCCSADGDAPFSCAICETRGPKWCGEHAHLLIAPTPQAGCGVSFSHDWHGYLDLDGRTRVCDGEPRAIPPAACPDCGHQHTPNGCTGEPTPSDLWAGVSPAVCDCEPA